MRRRKKDAERKLKEFVECFVVVVKTRQRHPSPKEQLKQIIDEARNLKGMGPDVDECVAMLNDVQNLPALERFSYADWTKRSYAYDWNVGTSDPPSGIGYEEYEYFRFSCPKVERGVVTKVLISRKKRTESVAKSRERVCGGSNKTVGKKLKQLAECFHATVLALEREPELGDRLDEFLGEARVALNTEARCTFDVDDARILRVPPGETGHRGRKRSTLRVVQNFTSAMDGENWAEIEMTYTFICGEQKVKTVVTRHYGSW